MTEDELPDDIVALLRAAGWTPGRRPPIDALVRTLRSMGFPVPEAAVAFLSRYAGLSLQHEPSIDRPGGRSSCWTRFDPSVVATRRDAEVAERCGEVSGTPLCPVGTDGFHLTLYVAGDGSFFAGRDSVVFRYAGSDVELFRAMRQGRRPVRAGEWTLR